MTDQISKDELRRIVGKLSVDGSQVGLSDALDQVVRTASTFFSVAGAGIIFADDEHVLHYVADQDSARLEEAQRRHGRGPCVDALEHRVVIERAVGILMEREGLDAPAAFERLRRLARDSRRRAFEIAADIVERRR